MYWLRRRLLSQNFLVNRKLVRKLIRSSSISPSDTVLEIGSGTGIITQELLRITSHVIPIEKDPNLTKHPQDFLAYPLPKTPYKVFSNIPFSITGDIIRKLLQSPHPPSDCNLIVQSEAATKFMIAPYHFAHNPHANFIPPAQWLADFKRSDRRIVSGSYTRLLDEQSKLQKIHRTRTDRNWKKFKPAAP